MSITASGILNLARMTGGEPLATLTNRRVFSVRALDGESGLEITPISTGRPRRASLNQIGDTIDEYVRSGSLRKADYEHISFAASYILALIKHFEDSDRSAVIFSSRKLDEEHERCVRVAMKVSLQDLERKIGATNTNPERVSVLSSAFLRNPDVVAFVKKRANGCCELCGAPAPFVRASDGEPYLEIHHVIQLAHGGNDHPDNAVAACPNCHRKAHYGAPAPTQ